MPQVQLPVFPVGTTAITPELGFERRDQQVVYLNGHLPVFTHQVSDLASFRFFTSQLIANGTASQGQIAAAFGVPLITVKRYYSRYRKQGAAAFFQGSPRRKGHRLTPERLVEVQAWLDEGLSVPEISRRTGLLASTLHKALNSGRLKRSKKKPILRRGLMKQPLPAHRVSGAP
jgi:transposase